jgi:hypothetical protein
MRRVVGGGLALAALFLCAGPVLAAPTPGCADQLTQAQIDARALPAAQRPAELTLYVKFYLCLGLSTAEARAFASLRVQLVNASEAFAARKITPAAYRAFILDRQRKADRMRKSPSYAKAVAAGDRDGDFVPDSADRCPATKRLAPTDDRGCDVVCPPAGRPTTDPICIAAALPAGEVDPRGPLLDATVPVNLSCNDAQPSASTPIAWSARRTSAVSATPPSSTVERSGYYFSVRRTNPQPSGCEVWYALQFVFRSPSVAGSPPIDIVSVLFSSKEDEFEGRQPIARFPMYGNSSLFENGTLTSATPLTLSPGRERLRVNLHDYSDVSIRVRVVTGGQKASMWSPYVQKSRGPEISDCTGSCP